MAIDTTGLSAVIFPNTLSTGDSSYPIVLENEVRGGLQFVTGGSNDTHLNIAGQRLQFGMLVWNAADATYYQYTGTTARNAMGELNNTSADWTAVRFGGGGGDIQLWRPETNYTAGQILLRTAESTESGITVASAGGLFYVVNTHTSPMNFSDDANLVPIPLTEVEWTAKLFDPRGFYETGDLVTVETGTNSGIYNVWLHSGPGLDGRVRTGGIDIPDRPGGSTAGLWTLLETGDQVTGVDIAPLSVRLGGLSGSHVLRTASTNTRAGDLVNTRNSLTTESSFETLAGGNRVVIHSPPIQRNGVDLVQGEEFVVTLADSALAGNWANGTYLVSFVGYITGADNEVDTVFDDVRPLDAQGTAGNALTFTNSNGFSSVGSNISFFEATQTLASFEFHNTDTDENVFTVDYTSEVVDFSQTPTVRGEDIVLPSTDVRVRDARLDGTTLRFYYGTDTTGLGDFAENLGDLANIPVRSYATITERDADTTITTTVFASVLSDLGDGTPTSTGNPATYILRQIPSDIATAGTDNDDWARVTSPDTILNEVQVGQYRPFLDTDGNPSRDPADSSRPNTAADTNGYIYCEAGETSDSGGITRDIADARYLRVDTSNAAQNNILEAQRHQARFNIDAAGEDEIAALHNDIDNLDPFSGIPHGEAYTYTEDTNISNNLTTNTNEDYYNRLGLFLDIGSSASDIPEGTVRYLFDNGDDSTGNHVITLRKNSLSRTQTQGGFTYSFDVTYGREYLNNFLTRIGSSNTYDLDLTTTAAQATFGTFYSRSDTTRRGFLERSATGEVTWSYPENTLTETVAVQDNTATVGAIRSALDMTAGASVEMYSDAVTFTGRNYRWPTSVPANDSGLPQGWTYTPGNGNQAFDGATEQQRCDAGGQFTNGTTRSKNFRRMDIDVNVTSIDGSAGTASPLLFVMHRAADGTLSLLANSTAFFSSTGNNISTEGQHTFTLIDDVTTTVEAGDSLSVTMLEFSDTERPFTAEILAVRLSPTVDPWLNPVHPLGSTAGEGPFGCLLYTSPSPRDS